MKIEDRREYGDKSVAVLGAGSIFEYNDEIFIRTDRANYVCLTNGKLYDAIPGRVQELKDVTLVIEGSRRTSD